MADASASHDLRDQSVGRILSALSVEAASGEIEGDVLRAAFESEGRSFIDLPEVGLWLAVAEISLRGEFDAHITEDNSVVIDLRNHEVPEDEQFGGPTFDSTAPQTVKPIAPDSVIVPETTMPSSLWPDAVKWDDAKESQIPAPGSVHAVTAGSPFHPNPQRGDQAQLRGLNSPHLTGVGLERINDAETNWIQRFFRSLSDAIRRIVGPKAKPSLPQAVSESLTLQPGLTLLSAASEDRRAHDQWAAEAVDSMRELAIHLRGMEFRSSAPLQQHRSSAETDPVGTAVPDQFWPQAFTRFSADLAALLRLPAQARESLEPKPDAEPEPEPELVAADTLAASTLAPSTIAAQPDVGRAEVPAPDSSETTSFDPAIVELPIEILSPANRLGVLASRTAEFRRYLYLCLGDPLAIDLSTFDESNAAVPDLYWPPIVLRRWEYEGIDRSTKPSAPTSAVELETSLASILQSTTLVGEHDFRSLIDEIQVSVVRLLIAESLESVAHRFPALLSGLLVHTSMMHTTPMSFNRHVGARALQLSPQLGTAISIAFAGIDKPTFGEVEQRDTSSPEVRCLHRLQMHAGLRAQRIDEVLDTIAASYWSGAMSGREIAADWLYARHTVEPVIGVVPFQLLTSTHHGDRLLNDLFRHVRSRTAGLKALSLTQRSRLGPQLCEEVDLWCAQQTEPAEPWGVIVRPHLILGAAASDGPTVVLPANQLRWHLNGNLLAFGSPKQTKLVPLPPSPSRRWSLAINAARPESPVDVEIESAADDRTVLLFDERGRYHHHHLPIGGATATVIAPKNSKVAGETDRQQLDRHWLGFDRITLDLTRRSSVVVSHRGQSTVEIEIDHALGVELLGNTATQLQGTSGESVVTDAPLVVFDGHVPPLRSVFVEVSDGRTSQLSALSDLWIQRERDAFGLDHLFETFPSRSEITVRRDSYEPLHTAVVYLQGFSVERPAPQSISAPVDIDVTAPAGFALAPPAPSIPANQDSTQILIAGPSGTVIPLTLKIDRSDALPATPSSAYRRRVASQRLEALWRSNPMVAALEDQGLTNEPKYALQRDRWLLHSGWLPPSDSDDVRRALGELVNPIVQALNLPAVKLSHSTTGSARDLLFAPLLGQAWSMALHAEHATLNEWALRHHRAVARWRNAHAAMQHLDRLWVNYNNSQEAQALLPLVAAMLLGAIDGPHRELATERLIEGFEMMPRLTRSASVFATAYSWVFRTIPEAQLVTIDIAQIRHR